MKTIREKMFLTWSWLILSMAMAGLFAPAMASAAQEASKESLTRLFQVVNAASIVDQMVASFSESSAKNLEEESDPEKKARKKAMFDITDQTIRNHLNWSMMEPLAIESYQKHLQEADILALIDYFGSPIGQLRVTKLTPALVKSAPQMTAYVEKRVDEIAEQRYRKRGGKTVVAWKPPVAGTKEALALTLMLETPGSRETFQTQMSSIEASMLKSMEMFMGLAEPKDRNKIKSEVKRLAKALKKEISFEEVAVVYAKQLAESLSEAEITTLIEDNRQASRKALLSKMDKADRDLQMRLSAHMQEKVIPELLKEFLKVQQEADSES